VNKKFTLSTTGSLKTSLSKLKAHWVSRNMVLWNTAGLPQFKYSLYHSQEAKIAPSPDAASFGEELPLEYLPQGPDEATKQKFPHLAHCSAFKIPAVYLEAVPEILKGQFIVAARDPNGKLVDVTGLQIPGVLDDLFTYPGPLGLSFDGPIPTLRLWAPTARAVALLLVSDPSKNKAKRMPMRADKKTGVWSLKGDSSWLNKYYLYEVEVYVPETGRIEKNRVTDPYSLSLSTNSRRSQVVDLKSEDLKPDGWDKLVKPPLAAPEDIVIYELHIRDFSIYDQSVPQELRGTYRAFTQFHSNGMQHLRALALAGLTHIHLLPAFDFSSVNDDKTTWRSVDDAWLAGLPPDSDQQARAIYAISARDGFNWGYDPYHFTTPEGSYATDPQGTPRILEFREMVQALNRSGLRVVMDVVYNHTNASGLDERSVFDKVVPGYYHRLDSEGRVENSTCCSNTASEHAMMRKLMIDSLLTWAREYKVDGFRFDLMGHHMLADMLAVRAALDALTLERDGVNGRQIYIYGEGWDFGEVAHNSRGVNAVQNNIAGTGIGVFNDRLRDAARGGGPFGSIFEQGFATGLYLQPNAAEGRSDEEQKWRLFDCTDWIRVTLAGGLQDYQLVRGNGELVPASQVYFNGSVAGFTRDPQENVVYVSAHDNETLWDILQIKCAAEMSLAERVRMNNLALSLVAFSQGVPFFHAGDDLLRSKSLDRNSYNSGDWFNKIDWTYESNNWGVGLPGEGRDKWEFFRPLLADPQLKPGRAEISLSVGVFREFLQVRKSSPLFRLRTAADVQRSLSFLNTGLDQIPGLIVMRLTDEAALDSHFTSIVVFFNARPNEIDFSDGSFTDLNYELHPVQAASKDEIVRQAHFDTSTGTFSVPGRTTAVFVLKDRRLSHH
jgi:pullulanase-type alpha-1,6-glucosidase